MFYVAICDDEEVVCSQIEHVLQPFIEKRQIRTEVFYSGEALYESLLAGEHYDLIFLNIIFKCMNGLEVGKRIRDELRNEHVQIIYISTEQGYAMELFDIRPMNFLIKPISEKDILKNVTKAMELAGLRDTCFECRIGPETFRIPYGDIVYFESSNRKVKVHTTTMTKEVYGKLSEMEAQLPWNFIRIHKSYLVNRTHIISWRAKEVILKDEIRLPISQTYRKEVNKALMKSEA